ncbi:ABC transporter ATP-binding protein [Methyloligella sp. 2.7D]|uniref:ABC transporter ATP-binding protein n=1 Tax=unclassified Methyloligella TaxID=2625955 RepID=UPI00157D33A5|nr:ABC transporter ATP-binding protein [Methyloligella sp. GL2]QKP77735.1 ABC transporter ATP-binding protein [Methyloligella sp. GL2]
MSLKFESVSRDFNGSSAVADVSLEVGDGEILCLLGPSGCGKTTLLRIAAGIERPASGRVLLGQTEIAGPERFVPPEKRGIGFMFQDYALFPHLTVLQNVAYGLRGMSKRAAAAEALAALERVGLSRHAEDCPHTLSGGEQQRVALARAIAPRPAVVLMDEPFSNLDARLRERMRGETHAILRGTGATCILVTHDAEEAMQLGDRIALMRDGRLIQQGTAEELYRRPKDLAAARFFSELNEIEARIENGKAVTPLGAFAAPGIAEGETAIVCLRQTSLRPCALGEGTRAEIRSIRFLGEIALAELSVEGIAQPLLARLDADTVPQAGTEIAIEVEADSDLIFPKSANR